MLSLRCEAGLSMSGVVGFASVSRVVQSFFSSVDWILSKGMRLLRVDYADAHDLQHSLGV